MPSVSPSMRRLARQLLAASRASSDPHLDDAAGVIDRLGTSLTRFAGADGFASLLRRALVLASAEVPSLRRIKVGADGRLEVAEQLASPLGDAAAGDGAAGADGEGVIAVAARLLELLVTFIGEPLTLRLVREGWPDITLGDTNSGSEADE